MYVLQIKFLGLLSVPGSRCEYNALQHIDGYLPDCFMP